MPERLVFRKLNHEVSGFSCGNPSIETQLRDAYYHNLLEISNTFEICLGRDDRTIGYFCLKMRRMEPEAFPDEIGDVDIGQQFWFYAVEIKYLAVDRDYQKRKIGINALHMIIQMLDEYHELIPYRFIFIDALEDKVPWYLKMGFHHFGNAEAVGGLYGKVEQSTVPMFYDLNRKVDALESYFCSAGWV